MVRWAEWIDFHYLKVMGFAAMASLALLTLTLTLRAVRLLPQVYGSVKEGASWTRAVWSLGLPAFFRAAYLPLYLLFLFGALSSSEMTDDMQPLWAYLLFTVVYTVPFALLTAVLSSLALRCSIVGRLQDATRNVQGCGLFAVAFCLILTIAELNR